MDEKTWLTGPHPSPLLQYLRDKGRDRKLRLFAVACVRRVWHLLTDVRSRQSVEAAEKYADGLCSFKTMTTMWERAWEYREGPAADAAWIVATDHTWLAASGCADAVARLTLEGQTLAVEHQTLANLLRHIIGNPFRQFVAPSSWPSALTQLAQALYDGEDCPFALADAMEEAGHADLAQHFRTESGHPKGCWAMDAILGRE